MTQPSPTPNGRDHIADLVCADIQERKRVGVERYGVALQPFNRRDALLDAYEEALDKVQYLKQALVERREERAAIKSLVGSMAKCSVNDCSNVATAAYGSDDFGVWDSCDECAKIQVDRISGFNIYPRDYTEALRHILALMACWPKEES